MPRQKKSILASEKKYLSSGIETENTCAETHYAEKNSKYPCDQVLSSPLNTHAHKDFFRSSDDAARGQ